MSKTRLRRSDPEKERYWRGLVQGQGGSGQSVREYCRQAGVKESAFYWWRRELARRRKPARDKPATPRGGRSPGDDASLFVPIHLLAGNSTENAAAVEIYLGDGRMVRVTPGIDRQTLVEVLRALEARPC